jgi:hypothetical protein
MVNVNVAPQYNRLNVLVGQVQVYIQTYNSASPPSLPADSVLLGTPWGGQWVAPGATDTGLELSFQRKPTDITIEEQQTPVDQASDSSTYQYNLTFAEDTLQQMMWAMGGGSITRNPPTTTLPGVDVLVISSDLANYAVGFEGKNQYGFYRRVLAQPCTSVGTAKVDYRRSTNKRMWATTFNYLDKLENLIIHEMYTPHT